MHANVQLRFNPELDTEAPYYRLKESYRDIHGYVHSLIMLNVGFEPALSPIQVRRIAAALTGRFENRNQLSLFNEEIGGLTDEERRFAEKYWQRMIEEGYIDRFNKCEQAARKEAERYIDLNTVEHTDARNAGAEWVCLQTIDRLGIREFLRQCSRPTKQATEIYDMLGMKHAPFKKMKICRTQHPPAKPPQPCCRGNAPNGV